MVKTIVITGAGSALGQLMVKTFAGEGYRVVAAMRRTQSVLQAAIDLGSLEGVEVMELDVRDDMSVKNTITEILQKYGRIDVLVNNEAVQGTGLLESYSLDQFRKVMDINLYGVLRLYREVLPAMRQTHEGLIINISSSCGRISTPYQVPYNTSRFALEGLVEGVHDELIVQGVECVLVEPGPFIGGIYENQPIDADREDILSSYGADTAIMVAGFNAKVGKAIQTYQPDVKPIADAVVALINMEKGTRPLRTPLDPIAQGNDIRFNEVSAAIKQSWLSKYME